MSANNQTLVQQHKDKYYVFGNIQAESWDDENELSLQEADGVFDSFEKAFKFATKLDTNHWTEYGVQVNHLCKDGAEIKLIPSCITDLEEE